MENQTRERALLEDLFAEHFILADRFDETAGKVEKIASVVGGTQGQPGLLRDLEEIRDSIQEACLALDPIVGAALPLKIELLKNQFDQVPFHIFKAVGSLEFRLKLAEAMIEAVKPAIEQAQEAASYSVSAHVHGEVGKAVAAAINEHLVEPTMSQGYIGKLEGEVEALNGRINAQIVTIEGQKVAISTLARENVDRWFFCLVFALGWASAVFAAEIWTVITHWVAQQPIPAWVLPRT